MNDETLSTEEAKTIIADQAIRLIRLEKQLADAQDSILRKNQWNDKAKRDAGFDTNRSFDDVWKAVLKVYLEPKAG